MPDQSGIALKKERFYTLAAFLNVCMRAPRFRVSWALMRTTKWAFQFPAYYGVMLQVPAQDGNAPAFTDTSSFVHAPIIFGIAFTRDCDQELETAIYRLVRSHLNKHFFSLQLPEEKVKSTLSGAASITHFMSSCFFSSFSLFEFRFDRHFFMAQ